MLVRDLYDEKVHCWLRWEDFVARFGTVQIAKYKPGYTRHSLVLMREKEFHEIVFRTEAKTNFLLRVINPGFEESGRKGAVHLYKEKEAEFFLRVDSATIREDSLI